MPTVVFMCRIESEYDGRYIITFIDNTGDVYTVDDVSIQNLTGSETYNKGY